LNIFSLETDVNKDSQLQQQLRVTTEGTQNVDGKSYEMSLSQKVATENTEKLEEIENKIEG
jgi:hypothetical protein